MVLAAKTKRPTTSIKHKKRYGEHRKHTKPHLQPYWPYLPIVLIIGLGFFANSALAASRSHPAFGQIISSSLLSTTNTARLNSGKSSMELNSQLASAAAAEAQAIVKQNIWSNSPSISPIFLSGSASNQYSNLSQSLAYGFSSPTNLLSAWLNDPHDHQAILSSTYQQVGYGIAVSNNFVGRGPADIVVAIYGQPQASNTGSAQLISYTAAPQNVSRFELLTNYYGSWLVIAISVFVFGNLLIFIVRHSLAWKKVFVYGEKFSVNHPWVDILIVAIVTTAVVLNHTIAAII